MKFHVSSWNNVLDELKARVGSVEPADADAFVLWQDVRGSWKDLVETVKKFTAKPVYVVQHGRGATRDYDKPNKFTVLADKFLAWGQADYDRMVKLGHGDKTEIVGCPLLKFKKEKVAHNEKVVLFIPVNADHEQRENLLVYYELLKLQYSQAQKGLREPIKVWGDENVINVPFVSLSRLNVIAKLLPRHDKNLYHGQTFTSNPDDPRHMTFLFDLLANVDCVVTLDESTTEALAMACDVPVVHCDIFQWKKLGGADYSGIEKFRTEGALHCDLEHLNEAVMRSLEDPAYLRTERAAVAERELGISKGDATENIMKIIGAK
jgi:hypothetical protein